MPLIQDFLNKWSRACLLTVSNTPATMTSDDFGTLTMTMNQTLPIVIPASGNVALTADQAAYPVLALSGSPGGGFEVIIPNVENQWTVYNGTGEAATIIGTSGSGVSIAASHHQIVRFNGTNIVAVTSAL